MQNPRMMTQNSSKTRNSGSEQTFSFFFLLLAGICVTASFLAPRKPDPVFIGIILGIVVAMLSLLYIAKMLQPKPINWITADLLFAGTFSTVHFAYFFYWVLGATGDATEIWYLGHFHCPQTVCSGLAMYAAVVNSFLAGYYLFRTKRWTAVINEQQPSKAVKAGWGKMGRLLVRLGCACFCAFILIVGPATFFGAYSGTNNISFVGNVCYQVGQVMLMAGIAVSMAAKQRFIATKKRRSRFSLGISYLDALLVGGLCMAIAHKKIGFVVEPVSRYTVAQQNSLTGQAARTISPSQFIHYERLTRLINETKDETQRNQIKSILQKKTQGMLTAMLRTRSFGQAKLFIAELKRRKLPVPSWWARIKAFWPPYKRSS